MIDLGINLFQEIAALGGGGGYSITNSLRFNDNDSAYLSRTPSVAGNRKTWTWSAWVKRGNLGFAQYFFSTSNASSRQFFMSFGSSDNLIVVDWNGSTQLDKRTTQLFRDVSGWYHIAVAVDTTQAIASDRVKIYVNGTQITSFSTNTDPSLNYDGAVNTTDPHALGREEYGDNGWFDGYMAEVNFIDGQALTPDDFGQIDATTGEWSPKKYSGTYGTNGFYLPFNGNANDSSGNGNNWTENNLASTDYMIDTPTNNFSVLNPLASGGATLQEGNLETNVSTTEPRSTITTIPVSSGKWYAEVYYNSDTLDGLLLGVVTDSYSPVSGTTRAFAVSSGGGSVAYYLRDGTKRIDAVASSYGSSATTGDIIGIALNLDDDEITFYKNNVSQGTITTKTFSGGYNFFLSNGTSTGNQVATLNQGADSSFAGNKTRQGNTDANGIGDFYYAPPTGGYLALCEDNLTLDPFVATGGTETTITDGDFEYKVHTFTSSGTFEVTSGYKRVEYLVVGGGGSGGGGSGAIGGGGGGAGGYREGSGFSLSPASYTITVGAGGVGANRTQGTSGSNSVFSTITAAGGGAGGSDTTGGTGASGGSGGGGAGRSDVGGSGNTPSTSPSQGNNGGNGTGAGAFAGGAGGGAGAVGANGPVAAGGSGTSSSINGTSTFYAGGGGGAGSTYNTATAGGAGGAGGGGAGTGTSADGGNGTPNTGGGGGASGWSTDSGTSFGGNGGSGIVIIRYTV